MHPLVNIPGENIVIRFLPQWYKTSNDAETNSLTYNRLSPLVPSFCSFFLILINYKAPPVYLSGCGEDFVSWSWHELSHEKNYPVVPSLVLQLCPLFQQYLNRTDARDAPCSSLRPPSILFNSCNLRNQPINHPWPLGPASFLSLVPYYRSPWASRSSELFHRGGGHRQHTPTGLTYLPLSRLLFPPGGCGSGGRGTTFSVNWVRRNTRVPSVSWKCKTSTAATQSFRTCKSHLKMSGVKPEAAMLREKGLNQALSDLCSLGSAHQTSTSDFLESRFV